MKLCGVAVVSSLVLLAACGGQPQDLSDGLDNVVASSGRVHLMPMQDGSGLRVESAPAGAHLQYFGGPVLKNVHVIPVYWNSKVQFQSNLNAFYSAVPSSSYYNLLSQYSSIGHGTRGTPFVDNRTRTRVSDAQVQAELARLITAGSVPQPNANNYYPVHFPAGTTITAPDGSKSCVVFCAYHGTFVHNGVNVNYGVVPDQGGGCAGGCGGNAQRVNNLTSVSSHEMVEATTDPAVGLATVIGPPLAWYDPNNGEIGDICNAQQGTITGSDGNSYVVQKEFSNAANDCVL
jgi:hypothetical protein